jgi:cellulose synthase/poly-beta-1,6-N-acetylglucosamine synthase-like glycosyltransferase
VYRLFFISKAPSFYIIRSSLVSIGGVYGEQVKTIAALRQQQFDLSTVQIILAGSPEQVEGWGDRFEGETQFHSIRPHSLPGAHYYRLKNAGAQVAEGEILAFTDSDVIPAPSWLPSLVKGIEEGAVATAGITMFRPSAGLAPDSIVMLVLGCVTWGVGDWAEP